MEGLKNVLIKHAATHCMEKQYNNANKNIFNNILFSKGILKILYTSLYTMVFSHL